MPLTKPKLKAIALLIDGQTPKGDIAEQCGVSASHFSQWQKESEFLAVWTREVDALAKRMMHKLKSQGVDLAVDTLLQAMRAEDAPWSDRIRAADRVLTYCGQRPTDRLSVTHEDSVEGKMSKEEAESIIAQVQRVQLWTVPDSEEKPKKTGT